MASQPLRWEHRVTRKQHRCYGCARDYPAGSAMVNAAYADEGKIDACYWCETCVEWMERHSEYGDEYGYSDLRHMESWNDIHREIGATKYIGEDADHG